MSVKKASKSVKSEPIDFHRYQPRVREEIKTISDQIGSRTRGWLPAGLTIAQVDAMSTEELKKLPISVRIDRLERGINRVSQRLKEPGLVA